MAYLPYPYNTGLLRLPASEERLLLPEFAASLLPPPKKPRKARKPKAAAKKFSGKIRLYWQNIDYKPDIILEIQDAETYAYFEVLHGLYQLEELEKWQNNDDFQVVYTDIWLKIDTYVSRLKRLKRLKVENWDWDWYYE